MNNNRGNNRRRGRGGNRQQGNQQQNRIDSRARGNAPQMLDKYKKLAHDMHLNGDRVQEEYYLQFADHYFRVISDQKQRQDEARDKRDNERGPDGRDNERGQDGRGDGGRNQSDRNEKRDDGPGDTSRSENTVPKDKPGIEAGVETEDRPGREDSAADDSKPPRKPRRKPRNDSAAADDESDNDAVVDPSTLPPAISVRSDDGEDAVEEAKPKRRTRRPRPAEDDSEALKEAS